MVGRDGLTRTNAPARSQRSVDLIRGAASAGKGQCVQPAFPRDGAIAIDVTAVEPLNPPTAEIVRFLAVVASVAWAAHGSEPSAQRSIVPVRRIFFCNNRIAYSRASALGGHPGT